MTSAGRERKYGGGAEGKSKKEETKPGDKGSEKDTREKQMK